MNAILFIALLLLLALFTPNFGNRNPDSHKHGENRVEHEGKCGFSSNISIGMLMIVRDEEVNIRTNLNLWEGFVSFMVVGIDERTKDDSKRALDLSLIEIPDYRRFVFNFKFKGLGQARSLVFREAWAQFPFPTITHVVLVDPDWRPLPTSLNAHHLDFEHNVFPFQVGNRNGLSTRLLDWCLLHMEGLWMKYRWHETVQLPSDTLRKEKDSVLPWKVVEVDTNTSYHAFQHQGSDTYSRTVFEIQLHEKDLQEYPGDPRVLYYLGANHCWAARQALQSKSLKEVALDHVLLAKHYFSRQLVRAEDFSWSEMTWAALFYLAYTTDYLLMKPEAQLWQNCIEYDPHRGECHIMLIKFHIRVSGNLQKAYELANQVLAMPEPHRSFLHKPYLYSCEIPFINAYVRALIITTDEGFGTDNLELHKQGKVLWKQAADHCVFGYGEQMEVVIFVRDTLLQTEP